MTERHISTIKIIKKIRLQFIVLSDNYRLQFLFRSCLALSITIISLLNVFNKGVFYIRQKIFFLVYFMITFIWLETWYRHFKSSAFTLKTIFLTVISQHFIICVPHSFPLPHFPLNNLLRYIHILVDIQRFSCAHLRCSNKN